MEDLHNKDGKRKHYRSYWVGNPGDQPLWTPKQHLTITNVQEEESKNTEAIPLDISKQVKINPWDRKQNSVIFGCLPHESIEVTICNMIDVLEKGLQARVK